jgi:uncharacterized membrane protein
MKGCSWTMIVLFCIGFFDFSWCVHCFNYTCVSPNGYGTSPNGEERKMNVMMNDVMFGNNHNKVN